MTAIAMRLTGSAQASFKLEDGLPRPSRGFLDGLGRPSSRHAAPRGQWYYRGDYASRSPVDGRRRHDARRGYSLIEALVVISINSILMAVALTLLGLLLKSERHGRRHYEQTRAVMRLADDLHRDAATAGRAESDPAEAKLRFQLPDDRTIEFARDDDRIRRVELAGSSVVRREAYHVADLSAAKFTVLPDKLISVELTTSDEPNEPWRIDARLAKEAAP